MARKKCSPVTPKIDILICIGCERCVETCRAKALSMRRIEDWGYSHLLFPERCTGCGTCAETCYEKAIELVYQYEMQYS